ncbi:hypothetical protein PPACK8108_LOCUS4080 [Phakopsora pachyrhizi]|uniref:Uncharacterized protein n=1 Tax=Phakopsora pachyrhizi TaxID=170000 RepID=A0AAV0AMW9_PHAPC|nr:hypothetical protein PPACK8108_LOCUS4080 [Phakopsora pachyrhizi]
MQDRSLTGVKGGKLLSSVEMQVPRQVGASIFDSSRAGWTLKGGLWVGWGSDGWAALLVWAGGLSNAIDDNTGDKAYARRTGPTAESDALLGLKNSTFQNTAADEAPMLDEGREQGNVSSEGERSEKKTPQLGAMKKGRGVVLDEAKTQRDLEEKQRYGEPTRIVYLTNMVDVIKVDDNLSMEIGLAEVD